MFLNSNSCDSILTVNQSYFVTELLGTDLHRLLTSRPLEKQFIQYFLYQILVSLPLPLSQFGLLIISLAGLKIRAFRWCCPS